MITIDGIKYKPLVRVENDYTVNTYLIEEKWFTDNGFDDIYRIDSDTDLGRKIDDTLYHMSESEEPGYNFIKIEDELIINLV